VKHSYFVVCEATCFDLLVGHHQAVLNFESIDAVYILRSQYVYIVKIHNSSKLVTQVEGMWVYITVCS